MRTESTANQSRQLTEDELKASFRLFLTVVWRCLGLPVPNDIQLSIADYLQYGGSSRSIIMAFRGVGKSWITSAYVVWRLWKDPQLRVMVLSATERRALDFSTFTQRLMREIPFLTELVPTAAMKSSGHRWSRESFDVAPARPHHSPSVKSVGITGQITGSRADLIVADDVEIPGNSSTETEREKILKRYLEVESILTPSPSAEIKVLGTPQTQDTVYYKLVDRGYHCRIWPARYPEDSLMYNGRLCPILAETLATNPQVFGRSTNPDRFTDDDLLKRELAMGSSMFQLQFMLDPTQNDTLRYPLKTRDLIVMGLNPHKAPAMVAWSSSKDHDTGIPNVGFSGDRMFSPSFVDPLWAPYESAVMTIDPSGRGRDEMAWCCAKYLHGYIYILECRGVRGEGYSESALSELVAAAKRNDIKHVIIEDNFGDGMFTNLLKPVAARMKWPLNIEGSHSTGQKELRIISTLEPVMNQHRLVVDVGCAQKDIEEETKGNNDGDGLSYSLLYQLTHITKDRKALKHDDRLEALSMAVSHFTSLMATDPEAAQGEHHRGHLEDEMERWLNGDVSLFPLGGGARWDWKDVVSRDKTMAFR